MHEIITLQLGRQSNYTGAHFWNAQVRERGERETWSEREREREIGF